MNKIENLLSRLEKVKSNGAGKWLACCPAHADKSPSLSLKAETNGKILVYCFGGCTVTEVLGAIGMSSADLMPETLPDKKSKPLSNSQRRKLDKEKADRKALEDEQTLEKNRKAADRARWIWEHSTEITDPGQHAYCVAKKIKANGARLYRGALIYRLFDMYKKLVGIRFIRPDGTKRPLKGALKVGAFGIIGKVEAGDTLLIAEGFSTAASLHETYGHPAFIATDASNLPATAKAVRSLYPLSKIIVCADNDVSGIGQKYAIEAATACKGYYTIPPATGKDFNDILTAEVNPDDC